MEGHRGAGLDRARGVHRGPGHDDRQRADDVRHRRTRRTVQAVLDGAHQDRGGEVDPGTPPRRADAGDRRVPRSARRAGRRAERSGDPGVDEDRRARRAVRRVPPRRGVHAGGVQGRQLLHRLAGSHCGGAGFGNLRLTPRGGAAAGPVVAAQVRRRRRDLLFGGGPRQSGRRIRRTPAALLGRAGLRLHHQATRTTCWAQRFRPTYIVAQRI